MSRMESENTVMIIKVSNGRPSLTCVCGHDGLYTDVKCEEAEQMFQAHATGMGVPRGHLRAFFLIMALC